MKFVEPIRDQKKITDMKNMLASGEMGQRNLVLFSIGINTAYRISDLRVLTLGDVLTVSRGKVVARERLAMKEKKTGKHNSIIISDKLQKLIKKYASESYPDELEKLELDGYLFRSRKGLNQPLDRSSLSRTISKAANQVGLSNIAAHSMRKTFGYFLYKKGTSIEIIQELLNHSSAKETLRYIGITQEDKDLAVISLDL